MHLLVTGVRHRTASIDVREKFALLEEEVAQAIPLLLTFPGIQECAVLTTCNRSEIYAVVQDTETGIESIRQFYRSFKGVDLKDYRENLFTLLYEDAVMHLFRVASGLDSLILGEGQILGQVKDTLATAQKLGSAGSLLNKTFKAAISAGKLVRTETGIADKDVSVSRAAFDFARQHDPQLFDRKVALIGGGKMAEIMMGSFKYAMTPEQRSQVCVVNRSLQRLQTLSEKYGFAGFTWDQLDEVIARSEVLFVATGAPHTVLGTHHFENLGEKLVVDISVPRNVDPQVGELPNVTLFNTDDLTGMGGFSPETQQQLKDQAQAIIEREYQAFHQWLRSLPTIPTLTQLRSRLEAIRQAEIEGVEAPSADVLDRVSRNLVNKILHDPTVRLKTLSENQEAHRQALAHLFNLEPPQSAAN